jgi:aspartate aminotransferase
MTGWRIGYAAGPAAIIDAMKTIQSQSTSNPNSIAQKAAETALNGDQQCVRKFTKIFKERHDFLVAKLDSIKEIKNTPTDGAFYLFPNVEKMMARLNCSNDTEFAAILLDKAGLAVVPGSAFGVPNHIRISYATSLENLAEAVLRINTL